MKNDLMCQLNICNRKFAISYGNIMSAPSTANIGKPDAFFR